MLEKRVPHGYEKAALRVPKGTRSGQNVAQIAGDEVVVFIIGMHVNRWRKVRSWWPAFTGMPRLLRELKQADAGLLGARSYWSGRVFMVVQYWRSAAELGAYARNNQMGHRAMWATFNKNTASTGDTGIFHETYVLSPEGVESLYGNTPPLGLAAAHGWVPRGQDLHRTNANEKLQTTDPDYAQAQTASCPGAPLNDHSRTDRSRPRPAFGPGPQP